MNHKVPLVDIHPLIDWDTRPQNTSSCIPCVPPILLDQTNPSKIHCLPWNQRISAIPYSSLPIPTSEIPIPRTFPWLNIDYLETLESLPQYASKENHIKTVGIVGAGLAGIVSALELLKLGYNVKVYEISGRIGGRIYTHTFQSDPNTYCELGSMRYSPNMKLFFHYLKQCKLLKHLFRFPDPLKQDTFFSFRGKSALFAIKNKDYYKYDLLRSVQTKYLSVILPVVKKFRVPYSKQSATEWLSFYKKYNQLNFQNFIQQRLVEMGMEKMTDEEVVFFSALGIGTGGFEPMFNWSAINLITLIIAGMEEDQMGIYGGGEQLTDCLWDQRVVTPFGLRSLKMIHPNGVPYRGIDKIQKKRNKHEFSFQGKAFPWLHEYCILTPSPIVLQNNIEFIPSSINPQNYLTRKLNLTSASKVFLLTKTPFWKTQKPPPGKTPFSPSLTDNNLVPQTYLEVFPNSEKGLILLSYTWERLSIAQLAYSDRDLVDKCIKNLNRIYGYDAIPMDQILEYKVVHWNLEPHYHAAWVNAQPPTINLGPTIFGTTCNVCDNIFLASDCYSYLGGWVEGSLQTSVNAVSAIVHKDNIKVGL